MCFMGKIGWMAGRKKMARKAFNLAEKADVWWKMGVCMFSKFCEK